MNLILEQVRSRLKVLHNTDFWVVGGTTLMTVLARGISVVVSLVAFPILLRKYGQNYTGLWATITSFILLSAFADLGLGNAIMNRIVQFDTLGEDEDSARVIAAGLVSLSVVSGLGLVLAGVFVPILPWGGILNFPADPQGATAAFAAFLFPFLFGIPLTLISRVQLARRQGVTEASWQMASALLTGVWLLTVALVPFGIWYAVAAVTVPALLIRLLQTWRFWIQQGQAIQKAFPLELGPTLRNLVSPSLQFFFLQLASALAFSSDTYIVSQLHGPAEAATFAAIVRIFLVPQTIVLLVLTPVWPLATRWFAAGDHSRVFWVAWRLIIGVLIAMALFTLMVVLFREPIFSKLIGPDHVPSVWLLSWMGVWIGIISTSAVLGVVLNAAEILRYQVLFALLMTMAILPVKYYFCRKLGLLGLPIGSVMAFIPISMLPNFYLVYRLSRTTQTRSAGISE